MAIELPREARDEAINSIQQYFRANMNDDIGRLAADGLLEFFLEEIAPSVYNLAVSHCQDRIRSRASELDVEVHEPEFQYWRRLARGNRA